MEKKLPVSFFQRSDVLTVARELLGKILITGFDGIRTSGRIVETEAYRAFADRASHSFGGKRTPRNEHMYGAGGISYVYICYGLHHLMNVVTNRRDIPEAVLIRAIEPLEGIETMMARTGKEKLLDITLLTRGPGQVSRSLGIRKEHSGISLCGDEIFILEGSLKPDEETGISPRIGVDGAGDDARLPFRFYVKGNPYVSGKKR